VNSKHQSAVKSLVLAVERRWVEAHRTLDLDELESIMAEDFTQIQDDGATLGKREVLASYTSGKRSWSFAESDEYNLRVTKEMAVLLGRWRGRGTNGEEKFDYSARFSSVFVLRNGEWKLMLDHSTSISDGV